MIQIGDYVKAKGHRGIFKVMKVHENGDVSVYGGTAYHQSFRSFRPERLQKKRKVAVRA